MKPFFRLLRTVEFFLDSLKAASTLFSFVGWLTTQSFCGARRIRAPFAPPRLSEPRKVDADAQAVETISKSIGQKKGFCLLGLRCPDHQSDRNPLPEWDPARLSSSAGTSGPR